jgi:hypothetical protein
MNAAFGVRFLPDFFFAGLRAAFFATFLPFDLDFPPFAFFFAAIWSPGK